MRIAVTGAGGRIGRAVVAGAVASGHTVVAIDQRFDDSPSEQGVRRVVVDVTDYEAMERALAGCDALVHLAAITGPGRHPDHVVHDRNVLGSYHALRSAVEVGIRRICQASSVNAIGGRFSRSPRYDYFPVDELHPSYAEDPYSLSKWICEQQADAVARRFEGTSIVSLRLHGVVPDRAAALPWDDKMPEAVARQLWGYTTLDAASRAGLAAVDVDVGGHEVCYVVAPHTMSTTPSLELCERYYPDVPVVGDLSGHRGLFDCRKARDLLGWEHDSGDGRDGR